METTDVREHFLLAAERRGRPYRKLAWRCDARIDPAGGCVCLGACRRGHYQPKTMSLSKGSRNQRQGSVPFSITRPTICWDGTWLTAQTESSQMIPAGDETLFSHWKWASEQFFWEESGVMSHLCSQWLNKKITDLPTHPLMHIFLQALSFLVKNWIDKIC